MKRRKIPQRLPQPALGRGRCQTAAKRAFYGSRTVTTGEVARIAYARRLLLHGKPLLPWHYKHLRRVLAVIAEPIGRSRRGMGRPMRWRLKGAAR